MAYTVDPATNTALIEEGRRKMAETARIKAARALKRRQALNAQQQHTAWQPAKPPRFR